MPKKYALIGYTGFIGSNLLNYKKKIDKYNSKNITKISKKKYDLVICAGTYSKIWLARRYPLKDQMNIKKLVSSLKNLMTKKFILISTCEVYGKSSKTFENQKLKNFRLNNYGKNRLYLEDFCKKKFENLHIIRLPIVYGNNFKKNFIYDLCYNNDISKLNGKDIIQIYNVKNLKKDINFVIKNRLKELNISSPPLTMNYIARKYFKIDLTSKIRKRCMNMKSFFAKSGSYFYSKNKTEKDFKNFLTKIKI